MRCLLIPKRNLNLDYVSDSYKSQIVKSFSSSSMIENFLSLFKEFGYITFCSSEIFKENYKEISSYISGNFSSFASFAQTGKENFDMRIMKEMLIYEY